jgi:NAD(P)H-dependent FMN reductase
MVTTAILTGSTRPNRVCRDVAEWIVEVAGGDAADVELVDIADFGLPMLDEPVPAARSSAYQHAHTRRWSDVIRSFDAFVFVTPEYNHSLPGALKNALDFLYEEWNDKAAGLVTYGLNGGVRAAEHLRQIAAELRIATVGPQVALSIFDDFADMSRFRPLPRQHDAAVRMLAEVTRWGAAMRGLRTGAPLARCDHPPEVVIVVGRSPSKMHEALEVLRSAGFEPVGTFDGGEAMHAIAARDEVFAVVAGGSVDTELAAMLAAAAATKGADLIRTAIGNADPARHFTDHVLPELARLRTERSRTTDAPLAVAGR